MAVVFKRVRNNNEFMQKSYSKILIQIALFDDDGEIQYVKPQKLPTNHTH